MIAACDTQDFVPFGRDYIRRHPGKFQLQVQNQVQPEHGIPLVKSFRDISIQENNKKEQWLFHQRYNVTESQKSLYDEELYISGNTVVWSRGSQDESRDVIKTFTVDTPVMQALWCDFILPSNETPADNTVNMDMAGEHQTGVCVVETGTVTCFMEKGGEFTAALPFQVANTWRISNGLLFERTISPTEINTVKRNSPNQTMVFSMLHPLDEVAPVITKTNFGGCPKVSYLTDNTQHVVFTSIEPSLVLTYDSMVGVHSAWKIRRARPDECSSVCGGFDTSLYHQVPGTPLHNQSSSSSRFISNLSSQSPSVSPLRSFSGRISSPVGYGLPQAHSPVVSNMAAVSRSQSPAVGSGSLHRFHSPSPSIGRSPGNYYRTPPVCPYNVSLINESYTEWVEPLKPDICFEHLWTEPAPAIRDGSLGKSSKAFLMRDLCGQQYMCYFISYRQQLRCVKFEESNDLSQLIFGTLSVIPAKDAIPIESLDLLVLLDLSGSLWVYSGTTKINRLHVPTLPLGSGSISMMKTVTPINSPSRGIFTSSRPPSAVDARFDEEMKQISPVPTELEDSSHFEDYHVHSSFVQGIRDNIGSRFTLELINGHFCRASMPNSTNSPGIDLCLQALKHMLPRDLAITFLGKWYTVRNTPGGLGNQSEWTMFTRCLLSMMGYDTTRLALTNMKEMDASMSPVMSAKKPKQSDQGSEDDWETLLNSDHHKYISEDLECSHGLSQCELVPDSTSYSKPCAINTSSPLFVHMPSVFMALHLVFEELKLNMLLHGEVENLAPVLFQIASDLKCTYYSDYYCRNFPSLFDVVDDVSQVTEDHLHKMQYPGMFTQFVMSVENWIVTSLRGDDCGAFPYIPAVCTNIKNIVSLYALLLKKDLSTEQAIDRCLRKVSPAGHRAPTCDLSMSRSFSVAVPTASVPERIVLYMTDLGMTQQDLEYLPVGFSLPLREAIFHCRCNPPSDWPEQAYVLIGRQDLSQLLSMNKKPQVYSRQPHPQSGGNREEDDGMEHLDEELLRLRFSEDLRVQEVRRLLQSSRPAKIALVQRPEVSDHDFFEEQERHLYTICIRTMALPVGRGMFTMRTYHPLPTEALPIPKLCLQGRAPPRNATVDLTHIDTPANLTVWPQFHNGVAAGLRMADSSQVDSTWIIYNRPKNNELTNEYAGFLMALGLNGHLVNLHTLNVHDALSKGNEMITVGLLLGMAAAKRGTMDLSTTRVLSIHVPALLPPSSTELNVPHNVQVAAILGVGLVYQGTAHRHTADVLLSEIGRPPGPELENCNDRESYSLAAGLALGLVMFAKGSEMVGTSDLSMADTLCHFMVGGHKRPLTGPNKERYKSPSYQIKEGDSINVDVTSPGATLALGMLYFRTNNGAVAEWLRIPDTQFMLDHVRPDFLLLRTLARGLVMWDQVLPTHAWIKGNIPKILQDRAFNRGQTESDDDDYLLDYETMSQSYCNVVAGGCIVIGLKFAGTANQTAFHTLVKCVKLALSVMSSQAHIEQTGRGVLENCMMTILISLAMVMAGTGNLEVLRMCRMLRSRIGPPYNVYVTYGSHMAISMALGLLFLGGGRYSLRTNPESIAVMLCAFFPKFPLHSSDNRYHLQAFRHLFVLATEPRVVLPRNVDTGYPCYVPMEVKFKDTTAYKDESFITSAPSLLPQLDQIEEVKILGPRYWPIVFHINKNWSTLNIVLKNSGTLFVKQRAGHLSYVEDPKGYRSMLAKSLTSDHSSHCTTQPDVIKAFTSDPTILSLTEYFLNIQHSDDNPTLQTLSSIIYECVTREKPESISSHISLSQAFKDSDNHLRSESVTQLKLILSYYHSQYCFHDDKKSTEQLLKMEFILALKSRLENSLEDWQEGNMEVLVKYLQGDVLKGYEVSLLSAYLSWFDIPTPAQISKIVIEGAPTLPVLCANLPTLPVSTIMRILTAWKAATQKDTLSRKSPSFAQKL